MATARRLVDVVDTYLADLVEDEKSVDHVLHYRMLLGQLVKAMGNIWPSEITPQIMKAFFYGGRIGVRRWPGLKKRRDKAAKGEDVAGSTWNVRMNLMAKFIADVAAIPGSGMNPRVMSEIKKRKKVQRKWIYLSDGEIDRLIGTVDDLRDQAMLEFMAEYWPRAAEIRRMCISDVDLDKSVIHFTVTKSSTTEERQAYWHLTPICDQRIRRWLAAYATAMKLTLPQLLAKGDQWYLFPSRQVSRDRWDPVEKKLAGRRVNYRPTMVYTQPWDIVKDGLMAIGYTEKQVKQHGGHTLRRSSARNLYDANGQRIGEVQAGLGHASEFTTRIYLGIEQNIVDRNAGLMAGGRRARAKPADADIITLHGPADRTG